MYNEPPDLFIADTKEVVQNYRRLVSSLDPLGFDGLDTWLPAMVDAVGIESELVYNRSVLLYDIAGDYLYEELPEAEQIVQAGTALIDSLYYEFKRNGLYDHQGLLSWFYHSKTADDCIVLQYHDRTEPPWPNSQTLLSSLLRVQ